jgi:hypothetical protein
MASMNELFHGRNLIKMPAASISGMDKSHNNTLILLYQTSTEHFVKFRHCAGQLFPFRNEPLELSPADITSGKTASTSCMI